MAKVINRTKSGTTVTKAQDQTAVLSSELEAIEVGLEGNKTRLQPAYLAYLEARKSLAQAFKGRVSQDQQAFREAERRYQLCEQAIEKAIKAREKAELEASDAYIEDICKATNRASKTYKDKTKQAVTECKQKVMNAWKSSTENSAQMTSVCEEAIEKAMKAREKAELDALDAYKGDMDKAIDKASHVYKEKLKQALNECKQKVTDAWRSSMETSIEMTGVFEEDKNIKKKQARERRLEQQTLQLRDTIIRWYRIFLHNIQRAIRTLKARRST